MEAQDRGQESAEGVRHAIQQARTEVSVAVGHLPEIADKARHRAEQVAEQLPEALSRIRTRAQSTVTRLQTLPDSELGLLAAASIGLGTGLRLAGASRLTTLAGFAPASIFGFAIASRPGRSHLAPHPVQL